jgi:catechol 2,3-dioxygenase
MNTTIQPADSRLPAGTQLGRVRLRVADLDRALGFYRDVLGFHVVRDEDGVVGLAPSGTAESPGQELVQLEEVPGITARPPRPVTTGLYHVAFLLPSRPALGKTLLGLRDSGYPLRGMSDHAVSESVYLDDPDGNGLEIYADRPRSAWRMRGGIPQMTVDPMDVRGVVGAASQLPGPWTGLPVDTVVGHLHFTVSRLEPSVAFYRDIIGFDEGMRMPGLAAVSTGGYHHHLNLNVWAGEDAPREPERMAGLTAWELRLPDAAARDALMARLPAADRTAESTGGVGVVRDPDGVAMNLVIPA